MQTLKPEQIELFNELEKIETVPGISNEEFEAYLGTVNEQIEIRMASSGGLFPDWSNSAPNESGGGCNLDPSCSGC